ncbi:C40 family peptidase [Anaerocolumna sp.]|uniref:C40 family peptidase n=1 Tax=Anaerocolumna sp. TaxID=2041569 RepID=UPI0028AE076C|nr:NlpC/P60 family protein [Anaerocolumna sp.]
MNQNFTKFLKISTFCMGGMVLFSLNAAVAKAEAVVGEKAVAGITVPLEKYSEVSEAVKNKEIELADQYNYTNLGIANVENHLNIREKPGEDQKIIGKLPKNAGCTILETDDSGWAKIKSGKVTGYVMSSYLITGNEAVTLAKKVGGVVATVNTTTLNVRAEAGLLSKVITSVPIGEEFEVLDFDEEWVKIGVDQDKGYVSRQYVDLTYELIKGVSVEETVTGVSGIRAQIVAYAKQFVGNRYVWGGNSLTNGTDCSGFVHLIYRNFGYSIARQSSSLSRNGTRINPSNVKPGDLVFYGNGSSINHVAMYIGNGQIVHASTTRTGIKISNMYYRNPITAVRIIND